MRRMILIIAASLVGGCASPENRPASCRGALRPANPYGSVLASPSSATAPQSASSEPGALSAGGKTRSDQDGERRSCTGAPS